MSLLHSLYDPAGMRHLIESGSYVLLFFIIYAETGLMLGFFLPGDSLLVTAGIFAASANAPINIAVLIPLLCLAAILGNNTGYWFGRKTGPRLFGREDSRLFKKKHLDQTREFYARHGSKTIILARFMPFVRTFAPIVAGIAEMPYKTFEVFDIIGGIGWITSMLLIGYTLSSRFPSIAKNIDKLVLVIAIVSVIPMFVHAIGERRRHIARSGSSIPDGAGG